MSNEDCATALHFDMTSHKRIKGEQSSLIPRTKNGKNFEICTFRIVVETTGNIALLIVAA